MRKNTTVEEDANTCTFGPEFQDVQCLLISEVRVLLQVQKDKKRKESNESTSNILTKTIEYCNKFSRFGNKETVRHVRNLLPTPSYHEFEIVQLGNLCCDSAEEAMTVIPSLSNKNEDEIQHALNELATLRESM